MLELRLDNVAFRAGWGASRAQARQFVRHGHVLVNGKRVTIPSYRVREGDVVVLEARPRVSSSSSAATWTPWSASSRPGSSRSRTGFEVRVSSLPLREHIDEPVQEQLIVELYSK